MNRAMYHEIAAAYHQLQNDPELRVAVMYAEGDHFTSGLQLDDWAGVFANGKGIEPGEGELDPFDITGDSLTKPVVFAAQGICFTCGVEMMLNTDIRVAAKGTRFAQLEVKRGIFACGGATIRLQRDRLGQRPTLPAHRRRMDRRAGLSMGPDQELVEPGEQLNKALEIAEKIAKAAPLGVQGSLKSSKISVSEGQEAAKQSLFPDLRPVMASEDVKEGIQSFLERREAVFKGQ